MIFGFRDRGSGAYLTHGPDGFKMTKHPAFALLVEAADPRDLREGIRLMYELFGQNPGNGFELEAVPLEEIRKRRR